MEHSNKTLIKVGILIVIGLFSVLFLSSNVKATLSIVINETFETTLTNWSMANGVLTLNGTYFYSGTKSGKLTTDLYGILSPYINYTNISYPKNNINIEVWFYASGSNPYEYPSLRISNKTNALTGYEVYTQSDGFQLINWLNGGDTNVASNTSCSLSENIWYKLILNITRVSNNDVINVMTIENNTGINCSLSATFNNTFINSPLYVSVGNGCSSGGCINYFDNLVVNYFTYPDIFSIKAKDEFNQSINLINFSATLNYFYNGSYIQEKYNTTTGIIIPNINNSLIPIANITISSDENGGYFNKTYVNWTTSNNLSATIYQAEANITMVTKILNTTTPINIATNMTIITGNPQQSVTDYTQKVYLRANSNITIRTTNGWGYYVYAYYNLTPFFNGTLYVNNVYNQSLKIQLRNGNTNAVINNYSLTVRNINYSYIEFFNTTNGNVTVLTLGNFPLEFIFDNTDYAILYQNFTTILNTSNFKVFYTYPTNSLNITIQDEDTGNLINQTVTIKFQSEGLSDITKTTTNGTYFINNLTSANYIITFTATNYTLRNYNIQVFNRSFQNLNAFLTKNINTVIFTFIDSDTSELLAGVGFTMYRQINGTWFVMSSGFSDVTGKIEFYYTADIRYKFYASLTNYSDYIFYLNPIIFSQYTIPLTMTFGGNNNQDYSLISLAFSPHQFNDYQINNFTFTISSPYGSLVRYGYNISYPSGNITVNITNSGSNANGQSLINSFLINTSDFSETVDLTYWYQTTTSGYKVFTEHLGIGGVSSSVTFWNNRNNTYGLGFFERILVSTIVVLIFAGIVTIYLGSVPGFVSGLLIYSYLSFIGFVPIWALFISFLAGLLLVLARGGQ